MKTKFKNIVCFLIFNFLWFPFAYSQESCAEKLFRANSLYEKGQMQDAIKICKECANDQSISIQWQANRLLAMSYLAVSQNTEARRAVRRMLELNPVYKYSTLKDPSELVKMLKSVKVLPKFSMGLAVTIGGNFTFPNITDAYNGAYYSKSYNLQGSWQSGAIVGYTINPLISLHSGLIASSKHYNLLYNTGDWKFEISERLTYLDIPLFSRFTFMQKKKLRPFIDIGAYTGYLLSARSDFKAYNLVTEYGDGITNMNSNSRRNNWEYGVISGGGIQYKVGKVNFIVDLKYYYSYSNITNTENRYNNSDLFHNYYYLDDDIRLNNLAFSFSVIYDLNYRILPDNK